MAPEPGSSTKPSLLTLPAEIRNHVFKLVAVEDKPLFAGLFRYDQSSPGVIKSNTHPPPPALAQTCQQARKEVLPIFYGANTLVFQTHYFDPEEWYKRISTDCPEVAGYITKLLLRKSIASTILPDGRRCSSVELEITKERPGRIKISYVGLLEDECACELKKLAARILVAHNPVIDNALFFVAGYLAAETYLWACFESPPGPDHPVLCECGKHKEMMETNRLDDW